MSGIWKRGLLLTAGVVAGVCAVVWKPPDWMLDELTVLYPGCVYRVPMQQRFLALTFDDGPDKQATPLILAELRRHGARATFFLITSKVHGQEDLVRKILQDGHELGNHFTQDRPSIRLDPQNFENDLLQAHRVLGQFAPVRWARPASGWYSQQMTRIMAQNGYDCAIGSIYPFDVAIPSVRWATRYVLRNARPGRIVVLHDGQGRGQRTARVLSRVIPELQRLGYRLVTLSELVAAAA